MNFPSYDQIKNSIYVKKNDSFIDFRALPTHETKYDPVYGTQISLVRNWNLITDLEINMYFWPDDSVQNKRNSLTPSDDAVDVIYEVKNTILKFFNERTSISALVNHMEYFHHKVVILINFKVKYFNFPSMQKKIYSSKSDNLFFYDSNIRPTAPSLYS